MSPPIDTNYYWQTGPASSFAHFNDKICAFVDLFNHFKDEMLAANGGSDAGPCVGLVGSILFSSNLKLIITRSGIQLKRSARKLESVTRLSWRSLCKKVLAIVASR